MKGHYLNVQASAAAFPQIPAHQHPHHTQDGHIVSRAHRAFLEQQGHGHWGQAAKDGVSKTLNKLTKDYNAASDIIDQKVARYKAQFTQLDVLMSSLNNTSSYLTQQFDTSSSSSKS